VVAALTPARVVYQASSGVAALQRAIDSHPGVILVGTEIGLLGPELLIRKLRAAGELAGTRIVAIVPKGGDAVPPDQADAVLVRTTNAEDLRGQLHAIAVNGARITGALAAHPSLRAQAATAAEQVFGAMLQIDVQPSFEVQPRPVERMVVASVAMELPGGKDVLTVALRTDLASATTVAAAMKRDPATPAPSAEEAPLAAAADVLGIIGGRIRTILESSGASVTMEAPVRRLAPGGDLSEGAEGRMQVTLHAPDRGLQFVLQLTTAAAPAMTAAAPA
jgi:hypothetical protein